MTSPAQPVSATRAEPAAGLYGWVATVDHKRIGILYIVTTLVFFILGGIEAMVLRLQLAVPQGRVVSSELFNQFFTMHGTTMIFFVVMPLLIGIANYVVPLMVGAATWPSRGSMLFPTGCCSLGEGCCISAFWPGGAGRGMVRLRPAHGTGVFPRARRRLLDCRPDGSRHRHRGRGHQPGGHDRGPPRRE